MAKSPRAEAQGVFVVSHPKNGPFGGWVVVCLGWDSIFPNLILVVTYILGGGVDPTYTHFFHQKLNGTESQRTPDQVSCETELLDTQVFSGSVKSGSCWRFLRWLGCCLFAFSKAEICQAVNWNGLRRFESFFSKLFFCAVGD